MSVKDNLYTGFVNVLKEHENLVFKICNVYARDAEDLKDLFQEVVLQAWISYPKFNHDSKVSTWLYRVALNTALNHKRVQKKHSYAGDIETLMHVEDIVSQSYSEEYKILQQMIAALPPLEKALILLYLDDNSYQEIADIMGMGVSNVGTRLARIREKLKRQAQSITS